MQFDWRWSKRIIVMGLVKDTLFYSKILLFGEYGIIEDSMGLSIPYNQFYGKLTTEDRSPKAKASNKNIAELYAYLKQLDEDKALIASLDLEQLAQDVSNGLSFDSSIPQGFGVGSSGALVAAIYSKYGIDLRDSSEWNDPNAITQIKQELGQMESHFHGKSSGLDPLICYLKLPVLIKSKEEVGTTVMPIDEPNKGAIFLINSGQPGSTSSMVSIFMEKCKEQGFRKMVKTTLKKYNDACIKAFLAQDSAPLFNNLKKLSSLFLENFKPMIPSNLEDIWRKGLENNTYYLKLCGSGGGGYILGFTKDIDETRRLLKSHELEVVCNL